MIWHIFKKDAKLLWWLAVAAAALRFAEVAAAQMMGLFPNARLRNLSGLLALCWILVVGIAICAMVHQDSIPGVRQDWLVRPIRRRDLLLAKLLWVVVLIQFPIFIGDLIQGLLAGSGVAPSLAAASSRSLFLLLAVDVPFLAVASITRSLLEALTGCVAISLVFATFMSLIAGSSGQLQPAISGGVEWITATMMIATLLAGAAVVLRLQFFRRRTLFARYVMGTLAVVSIFGTMMPWQPVFAVQKALSPAPGSAAAVDVSFDPALGKAKGFNLYPSKAAIELPTQVFLPMRIAGLQPDSSVQADHVQIRLIDPNGDAHNLDTYSRLGAMGTNTVETRNSSYQIVGVQGDLYRKLKDQPSRLEIDYSLTLFQLASTHGLPALSADEHIPGVGWCATKINANETAVQLSCEQAGRAPGCLVLYLEHVPSGQRNPSRFDCERPDYGPYLDWALIPDGMARFGGALAFRDFNGLAKYPVEGSQLQDSRIVMRIYKPLEHFTRRLVISEVKLGDWATNL